MAATGLEALFDFNPGAAGVIAEERLARSLEARCVPGKVVELLARQGRDPFRAVVERLDALSCERRALRPDDPIRLGEKPEDPAIAAARVAATRISGPCRKSFESLFGLDVMPNSSGTDE
jgi:hypothetical protein